MGETEPKAGGFPAQVARLREVLGLNSAQLAGRLGVTASYLSQVMGGRVPGRQLRLAVENLLEAHAALGRNVADPVPVDQAFPRRVPLVSWARAGHGIDFEDLCRQLEEWVETDCRDPNAYALTIEGDSMEPEVRAGDAVILAPNSPPRNGDLVVARLQSGEVLFKKYRRLGPEGATVRLESLNPAYSPREFRAEDFRFIHPAVDLKRKLRR
jgi:SOS-response transcriptional repressor LexA